MRAVVSTIVSPPYGTSKHLVKKIQPTLNKNKHRVLNSSSFVEEAKEWNISSNEIQTSFDVANLYPSVPIDEAVAVLLKYQIMTLMIYENEQNSHLQIWLNLLNYV